MTVVAEGGPQHLRRPHQFRRLAECFPHFGKRLALIGVSDKGRFKFQLLLDAGEPGGDQRREGKIGLRSAPPMRHSMRMALLPAPQRRKPAVRLSSDQIALVGAKVPTWKRL